MKQKYTVALIVILSVLNSFGLAQNEPFEQKPEDDVQQFRAMEPEEDSCPQCFYNMLTLNWPTTVCKLEDNFPNPKSCRKQLPQQFTIHGLWPQLNHLSSFISYCKNNKEKFDVNQLAKIYGQLNTTWPSAFSMDATSFWKHEWEKHGTCTSFSMQKYFNESLNLHQKLPVLQWLAQGDIVPDNHRSYLTAHIAHVLEKHIPKANFALKCQTHNKSKQNLLKEIWICVKYNNLNAGNPCAHVTSTCSGNVYLPKSL